MTERIKASRQSYVLELKHTSQSDIASLAAPTANASEANALASSLNIFLEN